MQDHRGQGRAPGTDPPGALGDFFGPFEAPSRRTDISRQADTGDGRGKGSLRQKPRPGREKRSSSKGRDARQSKAARSGNGRNGGALAAAPVERVRVGLTAGGRDRSPAALVERHADLPARERELLADLFAVISEHAADAARPVELEKVGDAFAFACKRHADQRRKSGEQFINHPVGVAKICAGMRLDTETLCAALLHDTVEDTSASLEDVSARFGDEVAQLVDGVTKLAGITFQSRDEQQAENYRKMMVAMATDIRVILIKLADRLHNMRTLSALPKPKQNEKARETLEIYAPLAHRLGIHAIKWELEDLAFATLHPRKYEEIKKLVSQQRDEREQYVRSEERRV